MEDVETPEIKILVCGSISAGKSSILTKWTENKLRNDFLHREDFNYRSIDYEENGRKYIVKFWELASFLLTRSFPFGTIEQDYGL